MKNPLPAAFQLPRMKTVVAAAKAEGCRFGRLDNDAPQWLPDVTCKAGDFVRYQDKIYSMIQPHHPQLNWNPTATPALWRNTM